MIKKLITIAFLLIATTAGAQEEFYVIDDFSGMLNSHVGSYITPNNAAQQAFNVRVNERVGHLAKRPTMFLLSTEADSAIKSLYRYYKSDDTKYTVATYSTNLSYFDSSGNETALYENASDGKRWSFVTYKDTLIGMNGTDNAKKWDGSTSDTANTDGHRTAGDLVTDLGAPYAELNTGTDLDASSWYQYKVAFYDGTNYTYSDARSNPIQTGAAVYNISLTDIPLGETGTTQRIIYRTVGNATRADVIADTDFYKVATISDNSTKTYDDSSSDATILADAAPVWSTVSAGAEVTPPKSRFSVIHKEKLFTANDPSGVDSGKSTVYWSDTLNPDYFYLATDYELVRPDDGDEITFLKNVLGILTIGKTRTISKFYTDSSSEASWSLSDPFSFKGCVAPYSAVNASTGVIYLSRYGIFAFNGQTSTLISDSVTDHINDILDTNIEQVAATYHDNRYLMAYTSVETGASTNDRVLLFDIQRDAYSIDTKSIDSFAVFDSSDDFGTLYSGSSESDGNIYAHENAFSRFIYRYKSELDLGTTDSTLVSGTETAPLLTLGTDETWAESTDTWADSGLKTWLVEALTGYWYSPIIRVDASEFDKLYWNESPGVGGDVQWDVRTGASEAAVSSASFSGAYTNPAGTDISAVSANDYIQFRAKLTSDSYTETPSLFVSDSFLLKMTYKKEGTTGESDVLSIWQGGRTAMGSSEYPKRIEEIQVYYDGTAGTLNLEFENDEGDTFDFDIDLSVLPDDSTSDQYFGTESNKIYVHIPSAYNTPIGRHWQLKFEENGNTPWEVKRVVIRKETNAYTTFK